MGSSGVVVHSKNEWQNSSDFEDPTSLQVRSAQNTKHSNHPVLSRSPFQPFPGLLSTVNTYQV